TPNPRKTLCKKSLKITKNRTFYDYATLTTFENTVNDGSFTATQPNGHVVSFGDETVKCTTIEPARSYKTTDTIIPVTASFEIYVINDGISTTQPHQIRLLNQGRVGWYDKSGTKTKGLFCTTNGDVMTEDVQLYGDGTPYDTTIKVRDGDGNIFAPVSC